jgi:hypothetical protein
MSLKIALLSSILLFGAQSVQLASADEPHPEAHAQPKATAPPQKGAAPINGYAQPRPYAPSTGYAPPRNYAPTKPAYDAHGQVLDARYNHGRYYPPVGTVSASLPPDYRPYYRGSQPYYFHGGIWYAPRGSGFVVINPPVGLVIAALPPYYSTVWISGVPYYYADNAYYSWQPDQNGYAVVEPPNDADAPSAPPDGAQMDLIIYPKNGQSKDQQAADQYECNNWATGQTGFDPTQPSGGAAGDPDLNRSNYNRAMSACLQARGYQVN